MKNYIRRIGFKGARTLAGRVTLLLLLAGAALWPSQPLHAATRQWTGEDSGLWSDPDNWFPVGVPQNGDSLTFPAIGPLDATSMVNDLTGLTVGNMTFTAGGYALKGNALTFVQGITDNHTSGGLNIVRCNIQFSGVRGRFNSLGTGLLEINGTTTLVNNQELIITPVIANLTVSGAIVGSGSLVKRDDGALFLRGSANNNYSGATRVEGGALHLAKTGAARAISAVVTIDGRFIGNAALFDDLPGQYPPALSMVLTNGGIWGLTNGATVTNIVIADAKILGSGLLNLECDVIAHDFCQTFCSFNLGNQTRTFTVDSSDSLGQLDVFGNILGPLGSNHSGIIKTGEGLLILKNQNTYLGPTLVKDGDIHVQHGGALGSAGVGGETRLQGGVLRLDGGTFTCPEGIVVEAPFSPVIFSGNITLTGPVTLGDSVILRGIGLDHTRRLEIAGVIAGPGGLNVVGGVVRLSGASPNTFAGGVNVSSLSGHSTDIVLELAKPDNVAAIPDDVSLSSSFTNTSVMRSFQDGGVRKVSIGFQSSWLMNGHVAAPSLLTFRSGKAFVDTGGGQLQFGNGASIEHRFGGGPPARIIGRVAFLGQTNELFLPKNSLLHLDGQLTGGATIRLRSLSAKEPGGTLILNGNNQFTGPFFVEDGILQVGSSNALGTTVAGTFVNNNASLALAGGVTVGFEALTLNSTNAAALVSLGPVTNIWRGNITLPRTAGLHVPESGGALRFESFFGCCPSFITGPGGITKSGPGAAVITGTIANNFTGLTTVNDGVLEASRTQGPALSSNVVVSGASAILRTGRSSAPQALPTAARMTVQDGALWTINPLTAENLSSLLGDGRVQIGTSAALTISNTVSCEFSGQLSGAGALNKRGLATLRVTGNSPGYTGLATVFDGTYAVDGQILNGPVTVKVGSLLRGTGVVGDVVVENGGVVKVDPDGPGQSGGEMVMNSAHFQNGSVLGLGFYGPQPTGGNDRLFVNNAVTLTSPTLSSGFNYPPRDGDVLTLINLNAAVPMDGTLGGFPGGVVRLIGGIPVVTSYTGGNGNDLTLTVTNLPFGSGGTALFTGSGGPLGPDDCSELRLAVTNRGASTLTGLRGALRSLTPGVLVTRAESAYPNLVPNGRGTNVEPFQIRTEPSFPCGSSAQFELILTSSNFPPIAIAYTLPGASGFGLEFDGRNDLVQLPVNAFPGVVNNFTIELWANPTATRSETAETNSGLSGFSISPRQSQRFAVFPDRGDLSYGPAHAAAGLSIGRNGISAYEHSTNASQGTLHLPSRLVYSNTLSGWTHVALVYTNRRPRLYVNGVLERSSSAQSLFPSVHASGSLGGSSQGNFGNFDGQLDEVRIWNAALTAEQIQTNMLRSLTGNEPNLVTYFRCDAGTGIALTDNAPASPNPSGTLTGGAAFAMPGVVPFGPACQGGGACESCFVVSGQFGPGDIQTARRLVATGLPSVCDPPKLCPDFEEFPDDPVRHVVHHFTNSTPSEQCVTVQLRPGCPIGVGELSAVAYLGEFRINQPCSFYLGDDGAGHATPPPFSFRVPPFANFLVVVTARTTNLLCATYALELFGLPCPPPTLQIAKDAAPDKVRLHWSSAFPEFRLQSANALNNPGPSSFGNVATAPVLNGGKFVVTNSISIPPQFFQLVK